MCQKCKELEKRIGILEVLARELVESKLVLASLDTLEEVTIGIEAERFSKKDKYIPKFR